MVCGWKVPGRLDASYDDYSEFQGEKGPHTMQIVAAFRAARDASGNSKIWLVGQSGRTRQYTKFSQAFILNHGNPVCFRLVDKSRAGRGKVQYKRSMIKVKLGAFHSEQAELESPAEPEADDAHGLVEPSVAVEGCGGDVYTKIGEVGRSGGEGIEDSIIEEMSEEVGTPQPTKLKVRASFLPAGAFIVPMGFALRDGCALE
jgi:hypothetical protein